MSTKYGSLSNLQKQKGQLDNSSEFLGLLDKSKISCCQVTVPITIDIKQTIIAASNLINKSDKKIIDTVKITAKYMPPSKQLEQELPIDGILCMDSEHHKLFIKDKTKPLCLKQETYDMLVARGYL